MGFLILLISFTVRGILALCVLISFSVLCKTLEKLFGKAWLQWFVAITVTQSHFMFYLSRPLPNIFALPLGKWNIFDVCEKYCSYHIFSFIGTELLVKQ